MGGTALPPEHGRPLDARLIYDSEDVVHHHLKKTAGPGVKPIGQADTAAVRWQPGHEGPAR